MTILQPVGSRPVDMSDDFVVAIVGPRCDPAMAAVRSWWRSAGTAAVEAETRRRRRHWRCRWQLEHRRNGGGRRTPPHHRRARGWHGPQSAAAMGVTSSSPCTCTHVRQCGVVGCGLALGALDLPSPLRTAIALIRNPGARRVAPGARAHAAAAGRDTPRARILLAVCGCCFSTSCK